MSHPLPHLARSFIFSSLAVLEAYHSVTVVYDHVLLLTIERRKEEAVTVANEGLIYETNLATVRPRDLYVEL